MFFSKTTRGFYSPEVHGGSMPADCVPISEQEHAQLLASQASGKSILGGADGAPVSADVPSPTASERRAMAEAAAGAAVTALLDALAISWQYIGYHAARTYRGDANAKYAAEADAICNYGSACFAVLDSIAAGAIPQPADIPALLALMPPAPARPSGT